MPAKKSTPGCLACATTADDIPLISLAYRGHGLWICPQHMPVLIHDPVQLLDRLPGRRTRKPTTRSKKARQ